MRTFQSRRFGFATFLATAALALVATLAVGVAAPVLAPGAGERVALDDAAVLGAWDCVASGENLPPEGVKFSMSLRHNDDGDIVGTIVAEGMGEFGLKEGAYDAESKVFTCVIAGEGGEADLEATIDGESMSGSIEAPDMSISFTGRRPG